METLFESEGIIVCKMDDGTLHEITAAEDYVCEDTEQSRAELITDAKWCVEQWKH